MASIPTRAEAQQYFTNHPDQLASAKKSYAQYNPPTSGLDFATWMQKEYESASIRPDYTKSMSPVEVIAKNHAVDAVVDPTVTTDPTVMEKSISDKNRKIAKTIFIALGALVLIVGGVALAMNLSKPKPAVQPTA